MGCIISKLDDMYQDYLYLCSKLVIEPISRGGNWIDHLYDLRKENDSSY